jgi:hypothetical protein
MHKILEAGIIRRKKELLKSTCDTLGIYGISTHITWATGYLLFAFEGRLIPKGMLDLMNTIATISVINFETKEISGRLKVDFMVSVCKDCGAVKPVQKSRGKRSHSLKTE